MPDLFDLPEQAHARRADPDTSHQAAAAVSEGLREKQLAVLRYCAERGEAGFIDPELQAYFLDHGSTYRTRRSELAQLLLVADTGERRQRDGRGRNFIVWRITPKGRAYLANGGK